MKRDLRNSSTTLLKTLGMIRVFGLWLSMAMNLQAYVFVAVKIRKIPIVAGSMSWAYAAPGGNVGWGTQCSNTPSPRFTQMVRDLLAWALMRTASPAHCDCMNGQ